MNNKISNIKNLLLVEDEAIIALATKSRLEKSGYHVVAVINGEQALAQIRQENSFDLILMDIDLGPGQDGTEVSRDILSIQDIPIVFVSSHTEPEIISKTESITSYGYIVKNSSPTVYDTSIKMAFKLFESNRRKIWAEKILESGLDFIPQAIFIGDKNGNVFRVNDAFAHIQKFEHKSQCMQKLAEYPELFDVYTETGKVAHLEDWALSRALRGESKKNVKYYIVRKDIKDIWIGHYTFSPIYNENNKLEAAIVMITNVTEHYHDDAFLRTLKAKYGN